MRIGLTGSFGSGKSTVSEFFKERGARIIDADIIAHEVTQPGTEGFRAIIKAFGEEYKTPDGSLDRRKLADHVFSHPEALKRLEAIVHPLVRKRELEMLEGCKDEPLVVLSVPLLFEKGVDQYVDKVAVVAIKEPERYRRIMENYGLTGEEIEKRLKNQMSQEEKVKRADYIIDNSETREETQKQVNHLIETLFH